MNSVRVLHEAESEKEFVAKIVALAKLRGWLCYHTFDSRHSARGFPDLALCRGGDLLFMEAKAQRGKATAEQEAWLAALAGVRRVEARLVRPSDFDSIVDFLD